MATFKVKLGSSEGEVLFRQATGAGAAEIRDQFQREGFYVFSVERQLDVSGLLGLRRKIPVREFIVFNKEFRGLVRAGLPIVEGLDILLNRMKDGSLKRMLADVREKLTRGESLYTAFSAYTDIIPRYYPALLHAGEQSGSLPEVLDRFIRQEDRIRKARKRFRQALTYPAILLGAGIVAMYVLLTRAMPQFASLYEGSDADLPFITQVVIGMSNWINDWYLAVILIGSGLFVSAWVWMRTESGQINSERIIRRIPLFGKVRKLQNVNIFARTMRLLIEGGIPAPQALETTKNAVPSRLFAQELGRVHRDLEQGEGLQDSLDKHTHLGELTGEMIRVGEATGNLGEMFEYVAESVEEETEDTLELISGLVAPVMLVFVGLLISFLVIAMYLPMFGSYEAVTG